MDGKVIDPDKRNAAPFIQQVMADVEQATARVPQSDERFSPIEVENGYAVWDNIRDEIYVDDEGVSEEFTSRWQAEEYARQLKHVKTLAQYYGEGETILIRQISYQITDTLQSAFPEATWEFAEPLRLSHLLDGDAIRLSTRNTGNHTFAEVSMDEYGNLHLQMLTVSALKRRGDKSASPDTPKVDPASWYSLIGKPFLVEMIGNLQAKGHQKLFIGEQGDVYILNGKDPEVKGKLEHFPPKAYWPALLQVFADDELEAAETENAVEITWA